MVSCEQVLAELATYMDHEVPAEVRREIEAHLAHCRTCQVILDTTRQTLRIVTDTGSFELPRSISSRIMEKIRREPQANIANPPSRPRGRMD